MTDDDAHEIQRIKDEYTAYMERNYRLATATPGDYVTMTWDNPKGIDWQNLHENENFNITCMAPIFLLLMMVLHYAFGLLQ